MEKPPTSEASDVSSAAETLREHIEALGTHPNLTPQERINRAVRARPLLGSAALGVFIASTEGAMLETGFSPLVPAFIGLTAAGAIQASRSHCLRKRDAFDKIHQPPTEAVGHTYELYQIDNTLMIHWHGVTPGNKTAQSFADSVIEITQIAKEQSTAETEVSILVSGTLLQKGTPNAAIPETIPTYTTKELLEKIAGKSPYFSGDKRLQIYEFKPDELREVVMLDDKQQFTTYELIEALRETHPTHPVVVRYDAMQETNKGYGAYDTQAKMFKHSIAEGINRQITNVLPHRQRIRARDGMATTAHLAAHSHTVMDPKTITQTGTYITGKDTITVDGSTSLMDGLGISDFTLQLLRKHPNLIESTEQRTAAILYNLLINSSTASDGAEHTPPVVQDFYGYTIDLARYGGSLMGEIEKRLTFIQWRRLGAASLFCGLAFGGLAGHLAVALDTQERTTAIASTHPHLTHEEASTLAREKSWLAQTKHTIDSLHFAYLKPLASFAEPYLPNSMRETPAHTNSTISTIGNIDKNTPNTIMWELKEYGLDTAGYWSIDAKSVLDGLVWKNDDTEIITRVTPPISLANPSQPHINVTKSGDVSGVVYLPVREGTVIGAASLNGSHVTLYREPDGSYKTNLPPNQKGEITYTIIPAQEADPLIGTQAPPTRLEGESDHETALQSVWQQAIPNLANDPEIQLNQQLAYLRNQVDYDLNPFKSPEDIIDITDVAENTLLAERKANCNNAASLIAATHPEDIVYVHGFSNNGGKPYLSTRQAHAWNVDKKTMLLLMLLRSMMTVSSIHILTPKLSC